MNHRLFTNLMQPHTILNLHPNPSAAGSPAAKAVLTPLTVFSAGPTIKSVCGQGWKNQQEGRTQC